MLDYAFSEAQYAALNPQNNQGQTVSTKYVEFY